MCLLLSPELGRDGGSPPSSGLHAQQNPALATFDAPFSLELVWKKSLGSGYSRITVESGLAITMFSDGELDHLTALDAATGEEVWRYPVAATYRGHGGSQDGPISTPLVDAGVVYGLGPRGHLFAVALADGQPIWSTEIGQGEGARPPLWGFATTPLIAGDVLIVQTGAAGGRSITGFRRQTGEAATAGEQGRLITEFFDAHDEFPIIEGGRVVHFVYRGDADDVALYGSTADAESGAPMTRIPGTDFFHASYEAERNTRWEYWFRLDFDRVIPDPRNRRRRQTTGWNPGGSSFPVEASEVVMPDWRPLPYVDEPRERRGRTERFSLAVPADLAKAFESRRAVIAAEREVRVYLPPEYDDGQTRYPLLVVNDGVAAIEQGRMDRVLEHLVGGPVAPVIVAFVQGDPRELAGAQRSTEAYAQLIATILVPYLDRTYRTIGRRDARGVMGTYRAGVAAAYAALHYPEVFGKAAVQSPALFFNPGGALRVFVRDQERRPVEFYVDWNRYDLRVRNSAGANFDLREDTRALAALLTERGYTVRGGEAAEGFGWGSWQATMAELLQALFPFAARQ